MLNWIYFWKQALW